MRFSISTAVILGMLTQAMPAFAQEPVEETEPNDTPATADTAFLGGVVTGHPPAWSNDDSADYWVLHANAGDTIFVVLSGCEGCGDGVFWLEMYAADGITKLPARPTWNGNDPRLTYVATMSGSYFVRVFFGAEDASAPRYTITFREQKCPADANEPNDTRATARRITLPSIINARWCPGPDAEFYRVDLEAGTVLEFSLDEYVRYVYDGGTRRADSPVHLFGPDGELLDSLVTNDIGPSRFVVPRAGAYYLEPWSDRGGLRYYYRLNARVAGQVPPGPGDPPTIRVTDDHPWNFPVAIAVDKHGDFWGPPMGNYVLDRVSLDGTITRFNPPGLLAAMAVDWDPWGNMLVLYPTDVFRVVVPDKVERLFSVDEGAGDMALTADAIWIANGWDGTSRFYKYSFSGQLLEFHHLTDLRAFDVVIGPSGDPYFASDNAIYRLNGGHPELVLRHEQPSEIHGFTFDILGNIYVIDQGSTWRDVRHRGPRVSLHDRAGAVVVDSFAWWPRSPTNPTFGRNADGTTNSHLYFLDGGRLLEFNSAGIRAPGLPVQPVGTCPVETAEAEPNDSPAAARTLGLDTTVTGVSCLAGDRDVFRIDVTAGRRLELDLQGADEPVLDLLAADGQRLAHSEDTVGGSHTHIQYMVTTGGTYFIQVASWFGGPKPYVLTIGNPSAAQPAGLTVGRAATELVRPTTVLSDAERDYLDQTGNRNGRYDVGDFRAYYRREHP